MKSDNKINTILIKNSFNAIFFKIALFLLRDYYMNLNGFSLHRDFKFQEPLIFIIFTCRKVKSSCKLYRLVTTADGSHTIYVPHLDEHYHSVHGAVQESEHIFIRNGYYTCKADPLHIFEAGFGTGLNALLTALRCFRDKRDVYYTAIDKYPLPGKIVRLLNYHEFTGAEGRRIFSLIHASGWNTVSDISGWFHLLKVKGDLVKDTPEGSYDLIYFDAFGPDKQPEMWTRQIFEKISRVTAENGILITYSVKGQVKRDMRACGFDISLLAGPPGKRHILRAVKK